MEITITLSGTETVSEREALKKIIDLMVTQPFQRGMFRIHIRKTAAAAPIYLIKALRESYRDPIDGLTTLGLGEAKRMVVDDLRIEIPVTKLAMVMTAIVQYGFIADALELI